MDLLRLYYWRCRGFRMRAVRNILTALVIIFALLVAGHVQAAIYYVDNSVTDSAEYDPSTRTTGGGSDQVYDTIGEAEDVARAGDTVFIRAGTYSENVTCGYSGSDSDTTIIFAAYRGEAVNTGTWQLSGRSYVKIIGMTMDCSGSTACVSLLSDTHIGIELWHNTMSGATNDGIRGTDGTCSQCLFIGNKIQSAGLVADSGVGIRYWGNDSLISHNEIDTVACDGIYIFGDDNIYRNNYTHGLTTEYGGHADWVQSGSDVLGLENNLFDGNYYVSSGDATDDHVTQISNSSNAGTMSENVFRRNVWHNLGSTGVGVNQATYGVGYTRLYHNTLAEAREYSTQLDVDYGSSIFGGAANTFIHNSIEYESWGSNETASVDVWYVDGGLTADYNLAYAPGGAVTFASPWTSQSNAQSNVDPGFNNYASNDFTINNTGAAYGNAGPLTATSDSGTGTTFSVATSGGGFFRGDNTDIDQYGGNLVVGDTITVGTDVLTIASISGDTITVTESFTWADGDPVYFGSDTTPDIGAYPYKAGGYTLSATYTNSSGTVTVTPNDADLVRMVVVFEDGIPIGVDSVSPYSVSGVGSGTLTVRVYPLYASTTLYADATLGSSSVISFPSSAQIVGGNLSLGSGN